MIWLNIIKIFLRIFFGLCCISFVLGMTLSYKHKIIEKIGLYTGFFVLMYGLIRMLVYAILGC